MKNVTCFIVLTVLLLASCNTDESLFKDATCITHVNVIDPLKGLIEDQTVIIKDGKILKVSSSSVLKLSSKNNVINGEGKYLIPGLWDAHVHFAYIEELAPKMFDLFLGYGITSVRDTGGKIKFVKEWQKKSRKNPTLSPRVMIAGPLLDGMPNVYDGSSVSRPQLSVGIKDEEAVVQQIEKLDQIGVDLLKAYEMLTPEQFIKVLDEAKNRNLKVTGHVPLRMDVITASNAGLNSMEHLRNLELACASNSEELLAQRIKLMNDGRNDQGGILRSRIHTAQQQNAIENYDAVKAKEVISILAKNDTWQIPTMALNTAGVKRPFVEKEWQKSFDAFPVDIKTQWISLIEELKATEPTEFNHKYTNWKMNMIGQLNKANVKIMAGTDCPIFFLTPGLSLHEELKVLVESGLPPLDALKTATINPAIYFGLENELGTIEESKWADLLLLNSNPLDDIQNTLDIQAVFKEGKFYDRRALDELLLPDSQ